MFLFGKESFKSAIRYGSDSGTQEYVVVNCNGRFPSTVEGHNANVFQGFAAFRKHIECSQRSSHALLKTHKHTCKACLALPTQRTATVHTFVFGAHRYIYIAFSDMNKSHLVRSNHLRTRLLSYCRPAMYNQAHTFPPPSVARSRIPLNALARSAL